MMSTTHCLCFHFQGHADVAHYIPEHRFKLITISLVSIALLVGILIPSIELIIGFIGSTIGVAICIMFPASCFIKVCQKNSTEKLLAQFLLVFGFILMVLGTYANLNAIDEKNSGSFEKADHILLKHTDDAIEQTAMNLTKQLNESPEIQIDHLVVHDVTPSQLESDLKQLPDQFETLPKSPDSKDAETKYHENPVDGLNVIEIPNKDSLAPKAPPETDVKIVPLDVPKNVNELVKSEDSKKNNDINNEAIQKEEQEIAIEKKQQSADDSQNELERLEETKKLLQEVKEMKSVLEKQNQETQQLVLQKFDEIVDKVEKIEKVQEEDNKKHEEEKAEKVLLSEKKVAEEHVVQVQTMSTEKVNVDDVKNVNIQPNVVANQTVNGPIISMLTNKQVNQAEPALLKNSQETNVDDSKAKLSVNSKEQDGKGEHAAIQRDLLHVHIRDDIADQSGLNLDAKNPQTDLLRQKRNAVVDEDCTKRTVNDGSKLFISGNVALLPDMKSDLGFNIIGRDLKSVPDKR